MDEGFSLTSSFGYSLLIYLMQVPGYFSGAFISEWIDRKRAIALYLTGGACAAFGLSTADTSTQILVWAGLLSFFMNGSYAGLYSYTPEVYATPIRATGMGAASAFGRVGGLLAPILIGVAYSSIGFGGVFTMTCGVLALGVVAVLIFGLATSGRTLEEIASEDSGVPKDLVEASSKATPA